MDSQRSQVEAGAVSLISPEELARRLGLSTTTLADWRSQGRGPAYLKTGRKVWYPRSRVDDWMLARIKETSDVTEKPRRGMALPLQARREGSLQMETAHFQALQEGRRLTQRVVVCQFNDASKDFLEWAEVEYRRHPNSYKRIKTSFASAKHYFDREPVRA